LLARGGMGAVYIAEQVSTGKRRALKVMLADILQDEGARERFMEEARATASIESDHVVETVAAGIDEDTQTPWLAMELLKGITLEDQIAADPTWGRQHARSLMAQLGHALGATHRAGVIHRDVKPANLFLEAPRRSDVVFTTKLLDFGIAKATGGRRVTSSTRAVGTPWWMSPEQAQEGSSLSPTSDVWAYGLVAFYVLTGREFWRTAHVPEPSMGAVLREMLVEPIPSAEARAEAMGLAGALPSGFDDWFVHCVAHDPAARFRDGAAAAGAFAALYR
ncbi:MAG: serine/threonine-protein kinase, partial [Deltaproteobacteria bacterium]